MDSKEYYANYFRPDKPLRVFMLIRVWRHHDGSSVHDGCCTRCEVIAHTPCEREVYGLGCEGRRHEPEREYWVCGWSPTAGISDVVNVSLGSKTVPRLEVIPQELYATLCERAAVLAVLSNLGIDVADPHGDHVARSIQAYLAHR